MNIVLNRFQYSVDPPNICPHCHVTNSPHHVFAQATRDTDNEDAHISVWKCANTRCEKLMVVLYKLVGSRQTLIRFLNGFPKGPDWPKPIVELKNGNAEKPEDSKFIKTYLQSLEAESYGLNELAGMGYRKSIEYLVKDWAIQNKPTEKENIEKSWLGAVISNYYHGDLKEILERATWLGNDQAHYNKVFEEYDIDVLKELIGLIMVELDREYKKAHYIETIQKRK
jgi:hypothetical protein